MIIRISTNVYFSNAFNITKYKNFIKKNIKMKFI